MSAWAAGTIDIVGKQVPNPVPGSEVIDHNVAIHTGADVTTIPGAEIASPLDGSFVSFIKDVRTHSKWQGMVLIGKGVDKIYKLRLIGLVASIKPGTHVKKGAPIGIAQKGADYFSKMTPYVHVELYKNGKREDPTAWIEARWKDVKYVEAGAPMEELRQKILDLAEGFVRSNDLPRAIANYRKAIDLPLQETNSYLDEHRLAHLLARTNQYEEAVNTQTEMLKRLEAEHRYANGNFPDVCLGITAAARTPGGLIIMIAKMQSNLEAYRQRMPSEFVY